MSEENQEVTTSFLVLNKLECNYTTGAVNFYLTDTSNAEMIFRTNVSDLESYLYKNSGIDNPVYVLHLSNGKTLIFSSDITTDDSLKKFDKFNSQ